MPSSGHIPVWLHVCPRQDQPRTEQPILLPWGSHCLPVRRCPSLTPRLSNLCLTDREETPFLAQLCHQLHCILSHQPILHTVFWKLGLVPGAPVWHQPLAAWGNKVPDFTVSAGTSQKAQSKTWAGPILSVL